MSEAKVEFRITPLGLLGILLTVLFVGLKLTGYIAWAWWWVLGPLWIPFAVVLAIFVVMLFFAGIDELVRMFKP